MRGASTSFLAAGLTFSGLLAGSVPLADIDWPLHVAMGRRILALGGLPRTDAFSWTAAGRPDVLHEWLFQLLWALLEGAGGPRALQAATALLAGLGTLAWFCTARRAQRGDAGAALVALAALLLFLPRLRARPDLVTWVAVPLLMRLSTGAVGGRAWIWVFLGCCLWSNMHGAALAGAVLLLAGAAASTFAERRLDRSRCGVALAAAAGVLATPNGFALIAYAGRTAGLGALVPEWSSLLALPEHQLFLAIQGLVGLAALLALAALASAMLRRRPLKEAALWGGGAAGTLLAFRAHRFGFLATLALLHGLPQEGMRWAREASRIAGAALLVLLAAFTVPRLGLEALAPGRYPVAAADYLAASGLPPGTRLCHEPGWGGYLLYRLWPGFLVAADGRVTTFGPELAGELLDLGLGRWPPERVGLWLDRGGVDGVVMREAWGERFLDRRTWRRAFTGPLACVWLRRKAP